MPYKSTAIPSVKSAIKTEPPSTVYLEGYLYKQKHGKCKAWLKRYFVLYGEELRYYKSKNDTNALAVISLDHYTLVPDAQPLTTVNSKQWKDHTFCLASDDETKYDWPDYHLQASSDLERQAWVNTLDSLVSHQSTSVLEKWLERVDLQQPQDVPVMSFPIFPQHSTSCSFLPSKSYESLPTIKRRPSDYLIATTRSLMSSSSSSINLKESKISKLLSSFRSTKSSCSSVASSTIDFSPQEQDEDTLNYTQTAVEVPIINPKDFDNDPTTQYFYRNKD